MTSFDADNAHRPLNDFVRREEGFGEGMHALLS